MSRIFRFICLDTPNLRGLTATVSRDRHPRVSSVNPHENRSPILEGVGFSNRTAPSRVNKGSTLRKNTVAEHILVRKSEQQNLSNECMRRCPKHGSVWFLRVGTVRSPAGPRRGSTVDLFARHAILRIIFEGLPNPIRASVVEIADVDSSQFKSYHPALCRGFFLYLRPDSGMKASKKPFS
jgi:hypothetical protein